MEHNDPRIIQAIYRLDSTLAEVFERWPDLTWEQKTMIKFILWRAYWRTRLSKIWEGIKWTLKKKLSK